MTVNKKRAILTFDYEVFMGTDTGTVEKSVIYPTDAVLEILKRRNGKAIFFVDAAWLFFIRKNFQADFDKVAAQLRNIVSSGSSVELHIHPQWLDALKQGDRPVFSSFRNYRLHSLSQQQISGLFEESAALLREITGTAVQCFRAGGWCIEPFAQLKPSFVKVGLTYDFSVTPGLFIKEGKEYDFDYSDIRSAAPYNFENDIRENIPGAGFTEIPVSTYLNNPVYRLVNRLILKFLKDRIFGDGKGIKEKSALTGSVISARLKLKHSTLTSDKMSRLFFRYLLGMHFRGYDLLVIVSHPKTLSKEALGNIDHITRKYRTLGTGDLGDLTDLYLKK